MGWFISAASSDISFQLFRTLELMWQQNRIDFRHELHSFCSAKEREGGKQKEKDGRASLRVAFF